MPEWAWEFLQSAQGTTTPTSLEQAVGLPAVLAVIRLLAHAAALVPMLVLRGEEDQRRTRANDTWQWNLLHKRPGPPPTTPFNFKADLAAQFSGRGNAYIRKLKPTRVAPGRPRVIELLPLNAGQVKPKRQENGALMFDDSTGGRTVTRGTDEIIQVRSFALGDGLEGVSPITACRLLVSAGLKREQFEERHLTNGIFPVWR
jgi:phage portal protein BeeE